MTTTPRTRLISREDLSRLPVCADGCLRQLITSEAWIERSMGRYGALGVRLVDQGDTVGVLLLTPSESLPAQGIWANTVLSDDAAVIISMMVVDHARQQGAGRQLVQAAAALMVRSKVPALEVIGSYGEGSCATPPVGWLQRTGFEVSRTHPLTPRLRLDLASTVRLPRLRTAWANFTELVRPHPPEPASRTNSQRSPKDEPSAPAAVVE